MFNSKRALSMMLAASLVAIPMLSLSSCKKEETDDTKDPNKGNDVEKTENKLDNDFSPNIPDDLKFDGKTFSILIGSSGQVMYSEEENSNVINDTVYRNNALVAEHFGIDLNIVKSGYSAEGSGQLQATQQFRTLIETDDKTYHAFMHVQHSGMPQMILERYFVDWDTIPYINLEDEWWYQNITNDLCFGDKIFVMTGDYASYVESIDCLVFNKDIFDNLGLDYPYQDVLDGTWTWDKFEELVKKGSADLNGDGVMTRDDDQFGLTGWIYELGPALLVSTGYSPLEKDADNMPVLNQNVAESHEKYDRIVSLFANKQYAIAEDSDWGAMNNLFTQGRSMFKDTFLNYIPGYAEVEFDFGIIPYPKWDEDSEYQNRSSNMTALTYIPVTNVDLDLTGAVLEEMAFQSAKTLTPTYFDQVLTVKSTRDVESEAMLPIIKNNARFLYDGYAPDVQSMIRTGINNYSSQYASSLSSYQDQLEDMRELLTEDE